MTATLVLLTVGVIHAMRLMILDNLTQLLLGVFLCRATTMRQ